MSETTINWAAHTCHHDDGTSHVVIPGLPVHPDAETFAAMAAALPDESIRAEAARRDMTVVDAEQARIERDPAAVTASDEAPSEDRFHDIAHGVTETYAPEGQAIWWRAWAMHPDQRARMEAGVLAAWSGEPTDDIDGETIRADLAIVRQAIMDEVNLVAAETAFPRVEAFVLAALASRPRAAASVSREQIAAAFCKPWHRDPYGNGWPLVGEDRFCGRCLDTASTLIGVRDE